MRHAILADRIPHTTSNQCDIDEMLTELTELCDGKSVDEIMRILQDAAATARVSTRALTQAVGVPKKWSVHQIRSMFTFIDRDSHVLLAAEMIRRMKNR